MEEIWKDVVGYEGLYQVSNLGRVKSCKKLIIRKNKGNFILKEKIMKNSVTGYGYYMVNLYKNGKYTHFLVHRLVALAFIPNPLNKPCINHIDAVKTNNKTNNLEWVTYGENNLHALKNNLKDFSKRSFRVAQIYDNNIVAIFSSIREAEKKTGICDTTINKVINGKLYTAGGYKWKRI